MPHAIAIHGGAGLRQRGTLSPDREAACRASLGAIVEMAHALLANGATALDVVVAAVVALEDDPLFNAGRGAVLTRDGQAELDAAVMEGTQRRAGAVAACRTVRNPVQLAARIMSDTSHVMLVGEGADALAGELGLECVAPSYFVTDERRAQLERALSTGALHLDHETERDAYGTVGAVACDADGQLAAATSTGGMVNQLPGRVGDTPVIGAGTFAWNATCAVSGTGHGEPFIRLGVGSRVSARMELLGEAVDLASRRVLDDLAEVNGRGGMIAVDANGRVAMPFNTGGMFRGYQLEGGAPVIAIW